MIQPPASNERETASEEFPGWANFNSDAERSAVTTRTLFADRAEESGEEKRPHIPFRL
jgi:hypothetical protein